MGLMFHLNSNNILINKPDGAKINSVRTTHTTRPETEAVECKSNLAFTFWS